VSERWWLRGTTLEACNCDPICPCRRIDGVPGRRSTHGECLGALSWRIEAGEVAGADLGGLAVVMVIRYHDDEPGSPWRWVLHVDARADGPQRDAIVVVFTGRLGGTPLEQFPWAWKPSELVAVVPSAIEIDHTPGRGWFRAGGDITVRIRGPYETASTVSCIIPGHDREGREVVADELASRGDPASFDLTGVCGFESTFEYRGTG
jgi:hypothetical protein